MKADRFAGSSHFDKKSVILLEYDERMEQQVYASVNYLISYIGEYIGTFGKVEDEVNSLLGGWPYRARLIVKENQSSPNTVLMKILDKKNAGKKQAGRKSAVSTCSIAKVLPCELM